MFRRAERETLGPLRRAATLHETRGRDAADPLVQYIFNLNKVLNSLLIHPNK